MTTHPPTENAQFVYLLNALENAGSQDAPADHRYNDKRKAVLGYVASLEHQLAEASKDAERRFPMQRGPSIPWSLAEIIYAGYSAQYGTQQSLERMAERGGFSWREVEVIYGDAVGRKAIDQAMKESK